MAVIHTVADVDVSTCSYSDFEFIQVSAKAAYSPGRRSEESGSLVCEDFTSDDDIEVDSVTTACRGISPSGFS